MYNKILVPLDGTESAESVIQFLQELAVPPAEVVFLRVALPIEHDILGESGRVIPIWEQRVSLETNYEHYLRKVGAALRRRGVKLTTDVRFGKPAREIAAAARAHGADLIAMSSHGRTGLNRLIHGSVSAAVLRMSRVPVLVLNTSKVAGAVGVAVA